MEAPVEAPVEAPIQAPGGLWKPMTIEGDSRTLL
jgi:hypothetical protein